MVEGEAMNVHELLAGLVAELPTPGCVVPVAFLDDEALPRALVPVEPSAFTLACTQAWWGPRGPRN